MCRVSCSGYHKPGAGRGDGEFLGQFRHRGFEGLAVQPVGGDGLHGDTVGADIQPVCIAGGELRLDLLLEGLGLSLCLLDDLLGLAVLLDQRQQFGHAHR